MYVAAPRVRAAAFRGARVRVLGRLYSDISLQYFFGASWCSSA